MSGGVGVLKRGASERGQSLSELLNFGGLPGLSAKAPSLDTYCHTATTIRADAAPLYRYSEQEVRQIRNSLKLGAKLQRITEHQNSEGPLTRISSRAGETGVLLAVAKASPQVIVAGFLFEGYRMRTPAERSKIQPVIERKFGREVLTLLEESVECLGPQALGVKTIHSGEVATLCAAAALAEVSLTGDAQIARAVLAQCRKEILPEAVLQQLQAEAQVPAEGGVRSNAESPVPEHPKRWAPEPLRSVVRGIQYAAKLFQGIERRWGPHETLPLSSHACEVAVLLALAGEPPHLVIAGALHDVLEGYIDGHSAEALNRIKEEIVNEYGVRVLELIEGVTEPSKSDLPGNWIERKEAVLRNLELGGRDLAVLSCATKISTFAAGNKMLYMGEDISRWSSGTLEENVMMGQRYLEMYRFKGIPVELHDQLLREIVRMQSGPVAAIS